MSDFLSARRARVGQDLAPTLGNAILLVVAGDPVPLPENSDQTYPYRAHSEYVYLGGMECAGGIVGFDSAANGPDRWISFVPEVTEAERVWEGRSQAPGTPRAQFETWLKAPGRTGRPIALLGASAPPSGVTIDTALTAPLRERLRHLRRAKDGFELDLMRRAATATAAGYAKLPGLLRPGVTERAVQIELEAEFFRAGGTRPGYGTIVGFGPNSAVLHFEPSMRTARAGDFVLVDAGVEIDRYMADVTRTYVVGQPSAFQRDLYQVVLSAEQNAITRCVPGAEWREIHLAAAVEMMGGLRDMGVVRGDPASLVEQEAHTLFFPHGLGHMVGLGVRDGSGLAPGRTKDPRASLKNLRMDLPLQPGYVVTVEPGLYFIPPLLNDPARREHYRDAVNWSLVDQHLRLGGVRIEDNLLVTDGAPENLTAAIPK